MRTTQKSWQATVFRRLAHRLYDKLPTELPKIRINVDLRKPKDIAYEVNLFVDQVKTEALERRMKTDETVTKAEDRTITCNVCSKTFYVTECSWPFYAGNRNYICDSCITASQPSTSK